MFKQLNIILCFLLFSAFGLTSAQDNFKVFYPEFIPAGANFDISIITSSQFPETDTFLLYLHPDFTLSINKIELWTSGKKIQIPFRNEFVEEYSKQFQTIKLDLADTTLFNDEAIFQIVISLKPNQATTNALKFFGKHIVMEGNEKYLTSSNPKIITDNPYLFNLSFNYYEIFPIAENAILLEQDSYLNVPLIYNFEKELIAEFWFKTKNFKSTLLKIINWETNRVEYFVSISDNQMIVINSGDNNLHPIKAQFLSQNIWHHSYISLDKLNSEISFYCNEEELARLKIKNNIEFDNLVLHFQNDDPDCEIELEQIRLVNLEGTSASINKNRNYAEFADDSSQVVLQINFSESELNSLLNAKTVSYQNIRLVKSDAPIFPRAPDINVRLMNNFYEIDWKGGSYKDAKYYVVEKAIGNSAFIEIAKSAADNSEAKVYSLLSERTDQSEIVYFRIKQVNKDKSEVYSDVIKFGIGNIEDVIISQNFPNPFNPATSIEFELLIDSDVEVKIYNLAGKEITVLHSGFLNSGIHKFKFDATGYPSGIYLYQIITPHSSQTRKMILAK